jgi:hypothetical protein
MPENAVRQRNNRPAAYATGRPHIRGISRS